MNAWSFTYTPTYIFMVRRLNKQSKIYFYIVVHKSLGLNIRAINFFIHELNIFSINIVAFFPSHAKVCVTAFATSRGRRTTAWSYGAEVRNLLT